MGAADTSTCAPKRLPLFIYALAAGCLLIAFTARIDDDVAWQLWIARQMNSGFRLYTDVSEVNPPLWFWMAQASTWIADTLHIAPVFANRICIAVYGFTGLVLIAQLCGFVESENTNAWLVSLALAYFGIGWVFFGQREHMAFMAATVYVFICVSRAHHVPVSSKQAILVGLYVAFGIGLKHYFGLVIIGLELWLLWHRRHHKHPLYHKIVRPELLMLGFAALLYGSAIVWLTPAYLHDVVPLIRLAYQHYDFDLWFLVNERSFYLMVALGLVLLTAKSEINLAIQAMLVAMALFFCIALLQSKGFFYHYLAVYSLLFSVAGYRLVTKFGEQRVMAQFVVMAMILVAITSRFLIYGVYQTGSVRAFKAELGALSKTGPIVLLSSRTAPAITASQMAGQAWGQRYYLLWMAPILATSDGEKTIATSSAVNVLRKTLVDDLMCQPPDIMLIDTGKDEHSMHGVPVGYIAFFSQDARFANLLQHYKHVKDFDYLMAYKKQDSVASTPGCRPFVQDSIFKAKAFQVYR